MFKLRSLIAVVAALTASVAMAQDWATVSYVQHSTYQVVNADGTSAYAGGFPIRMVGVVLNNTEDWLDPTPGYTTEILSRVVDDGRKNAAYPWCCVSTEFQRGKGYATCNRVRQWTRV